MKVALAQLNLVVGDVAGNLQRICVAYEKAVSLGVDLLLTPELALTGYPPRDLLNRSGLVEQNLDALNALVALTAPHPTGLVVGYVDFNPKAGGRDYCNSAALLAEGKIIARRDKTLLPTYDVFDEDRYFEPALENSPIEWRGCRIGLTICEDAWNDEDFWKDRRYHVDPVKSLERAGVDLILNISASPWYLGKNALRQEMLSTIARDAKAPLLYCNLAGGNDELIFDGASLAFDSQGQVVAEGQWFAEDLILVDTDQLIPLAAQHPLHPEESIYRALVLGTRDYLHKCGFKSAVLGLSGGIDSALVACIAVDALGAENVSGVSLPSHYSSQGSLNDARLLAENLGIAYQVIPIQPAFESTLAQLNGAFAGTREDTTEENLQARLRGVLLMALSNKFGSLLLTTGNKSEMAVGYCTLYGDMCGGLAVISDLPKTMVYRIARWLNRERAVIPIESITKAPSAELRPNQTDQDSLPPYDVLDEILHAYVVESRSKDEIVARGIPLEVVKKVVGLIDRTEYKRRQAAPGLKVTTKAFGVGRRIPIAQKYRE